MPRAAERILPLVLLLFAICGPVAAYAGNPWVAIAAGEFEMGGSYCHDEQKDADWCNDETPHRVKLSAYALQKYEVANADYLRCFEAGVCEPLELHDIRPKDFDRPGQPAVFVTWSGAAAYCKWAGGQLPTEAQWENAARAEKLGGAHHGQKYEVGATVEVDTLEPNSRGLHHMLGNVYEWTQDWYGAYAVDGVQEDPAGPKEGGDKVTRGGSWNSPAHYVRAADRVARAPDLRYGDVGFRCAKPLAKGE